MLDNVLFASVYYHMTQKTFPLQQPTENIQCAVIILERNEKGGVSGQYITLKTADGPIHPVDMQATLERYKTELRQEFPKGRLYWLQNERIYFEDWNGETNEIHPKIIQRFKRLVG
jgi:hypothetical protein